MNNKETIIKFLKESNYYSAFSKVGNVIKIGGRDIGWYMLKSWHDGLMAEYNIDATNDELKEAVCELFDGEIKEAIPNNVNGGSEKIITKSKNSNLEYDDKDGELLNSITNYLILIEDNKTFIESNYTCDLTKTTPVEYVNGNLLSPSDSKLFWDKILSEIGIEYGLTTSTKFNLAVREIKTRYYHEEMDKENKKEWDWERILPDKSISKESWSFKPTANNISIWLEKRYGNRLKYDYYNYTALFDDEQVDDFMRGEISKQLEMDTGIRHRDAFDDAWRSHLMHHKCAKALEWINSLRGTWDGTQRLATMTIDYLKVEDTPLHRSENVLWGKTVVGRLLHPECEIEGCLTIQGRQGDGKSYFVSKLGKHLDLNKNIRFDRNFNMNDAFVMISESSLVCFEEFDGGDPSVQAKIKQLITDQYDNVVRKYERYGSRLARHCAFVAVSNQKLDLFKDDTDEVQRRFWVQSCGEDADSYWLHDETKSGFTDEVVDQIFAEALYLYEEEEAEKGSVMLCLSRDELKLLAKEQLGYKASLNSNEREDIEDLLERRFEWVNNEYINGGIFRSYKCLKYAFDKNKDNCDKDYFYIDKIPCSWINQFIASKKYTLNYDKIRTIMRGLGWEKKVKYWYGDKKLDCWVREERKNQYHNDGTNGNQIVPQAGDSKPWSSYTPTNEVEFEDDDKQQELPF